MKFWWEEKPPLWSLPLAPLSWLYAGGAVVHRVLTRKKRAQVPVISIGNLTVGGAGKTPVALFLAQRLSARGERPAILSRGYGRKTREALRVTATTDVRRAGDEPLLLARRGVDVWVGPDRARLALDAIASGATVLLLDDGLQHHKLARDLDIVVVDASQPFGNGALLPRGPLRESPRALRRAGLVWLTRADLPRSPLKLAAQVESRAVSSADLRGREVFLFAGIARPRSFELLARALGAEVRGVRWFPDHHWFSEAELAALRAAANGARLVTTEKDCVRIANPAGIEVLRAELELLSGADALDAALDRALARGAQP